MTATSSTSGVVATTTGADQSSRSAPEPQRRHTVLPWSAPVIPE
nr:hypothetical protein [Serinicoccus hydrothermalis]